MFSGRIRTVTLMLSGMARVAAEPAACTEQAGRRRRAKRAALAGPTWPARTVAGWYGHCFTQVLSSQCGGARRACAASTNTRQQEGKAHVVVAVVVGRTDLRCSTRVSHTAQRATHQPSCQVWHTLHRGKQEMASATGARRHCGTNKARGRTGSVLPGWLCPCPCPADLTSHQPCVLTACLHRGCGGGCCARRALTKTLSEILALLI